MLSLIHVEKSRPFFEYSSISFIPIGRDCLSRKRRQKPELDIREKNKTISIPYLSTIVTHQSYFSLYFYRSLHCYSLSLSRSLCSLFAMHNQREVRMYTRCIHTYSDHHHACCLIFRSRIDFIFLSFSHMYKSISNTRPSMVFS